MSDDEIEQLRVNLIYAGWEPPGGWYSMTEPLQIFGYRRKEEGKTSPETHKNAKNINAKPPN